MPTVSAFVLDFKKYKAEHLKPFLSSKNVKLPETVNDQKIFSQFIKYFVLERFFDISKPLFYIDNGKPYLKNNGLYFNVSHTDSKIVMAVATSEIGIDAENISSSRNVLKIAKRYFSESEYQNLCRSESLYEDFYKLWTLKEAQVKRNSLGIAKGLSKASFRKDDGHWVSDICPDDFFTFLHDDLIVSICCGGTKYSNVELFEIVDLKFEKIFL